MNQKVTKVIYGDTFNVKNIELFYIFLSFGPKIVNIYIQKQR